MRKRKVLAQVPIIGTGAVVGCLGELFQLPFHVSLVLALTSQFVMTVAWYCLARY